MTRETRGRLPTAAEWVEDIGVVARQNANVKNLEAQF